MASSSTQGSGHSIFVVSERSLVVRTLGINEVRPLSNFDGFFPPIFQNSCTTIVLGGTMAQTPPLVVGEVTPVFCQGLAYSKTNKRECLAVHDTYHISGGLIWRGYNPG